MLANYRDILPLCVLLIAESCYAAAQPESGSGTLRSEIPFELLRENLIVVQGTINTQENLNLVLDTGANRTIICPELVRRLNLHGRQESLVSMTGTLSTEAVTLTRVELGAFHSFASVALVEDLSELRMDDGRPIVGIVGLDVLSSTSFMIDYVRRKIVFGTEAPGKTSVRLISSEPFAAVLVNIEGQELHLLVDTGTPRILVFRNRLDVSRCKIQAVKGQSDPAIASPGAVVRAAWFRASHISIGNKKIKKQLLLVADDTPDFRGQIDGLLGLAQSGFQKVWLDFEAGTMAWE